jgi:multidrug efflux pump subunit AcrA (membrane-fusion protein)
VTKGKIIAAVVALLLIAGIAGAVVLNQRAAVAEVGIEAAARGALSVTVSTSGKVEADETAEIYPPTAGTLASVEVTDGQQVKAGDLIATMDTTLPDLQVAQAQAAYEGARAQAGNIDAAAPSGADERAAAAGVSAAKAGYEAASQQYELAKLGGVDPTTLAQANAAVTVATIAYDAANAAYTAFKTAVFDPAPEPKDAALTTALDALKAARDEAAKALASATRNLAALTSAGPNPVLVAGAKAVRDQAWAAYQAALAQQIKLAATDLGAARASADAGVEAARQALKLAVSNREKAALRAPIDGTVVFGGAGASLAASALGAASAGAGKPAVGSAVSPATAPFSIVAFDTLVFAAQVDEADVTRIEVGQKVDINLDAFADETFSATVERVDRTAITTTTGGTAFTVICRMQGVADALAGMNGSAQIVVQSIDDVLSVPVEAVLDEAGETFVYVIEGGKAARTTVTVGRFTDTRAEITGGLDEGASVAVRGLGDLNDGAAVRVK